MSEERVISLNKEVLKQVLKDGRTYPTLAKQMAEVILEQMVSDGFPDRVEIIEYGSDRDFSDPEVRRSAQLYAKETGLAVYANGAGREVEVDNKSAGAWGRHKVYISELVRWTFGE